jgi:ABC-type uncharacterized transport system involved in gliding motility auxiliary subunit
MFNNYTASLLNEYKIYTNRLTVRNIDPDLHPDQARQYGVDSLGVQYGVVVFQSGGYRVQVLGSQIAAGEAEYAFTSAILSVSGITQKQIWFLTGNGASGVSSGYSNAGRGLRDNLFQIQEFNLGETLKIPEEAAAVVIAGPRQPPSADEFEILQTFLANDGRALLLLDPESPLDWWRLAAEWGIELPDGLLVDPASHVVPDRDNILVPKTQNSMGLAETHFPGAAAVIPKEEKPAGVSLTPLVWTSRQAWVETRDNAGSPEDREGPFAIGAMISAADSPTDIRLIVIGDSDFASDHLFYDGDNSGLFLTAVNWLTMGKEIISIDRKVLPARRLLLDPSTARFFNISSISLLPLLLLAFGIYIWRHKKRS